MGLCVFFCDRFAYYYYYYYMIYIAPISKIESALNISLHHHHHHITVF